MLTRHKIGGDIATHTSIPSPQIACADRLPDVRDRAILSRIPSRSTATGGQRLRDAIAVAIFPFTVLGVLSRPRGISEAAICVIGATVAVLATVVPPGDAWQAVAAQWDVLGFLAGLLLLAGIAAIVVVG